MTANSSTLDLTINGMSCGSCVRHVTEALRGVEGVAGARVDLQEGRATVEYDSKRAAAGQLIAAVEAAGYEAAVASDQRP